jgi:hypothetical protein
MDGIVHSRKMGMRLGDIDIGKPFMFVPVDGLPDGIYIRVNADPLVHATWSLHNLVVKIANEANRDAAFGVTKSSPSIGSVSECDVDIRVIPLKCKVVPEFEADVC